MLLTACKSLYNDYSNVVKTDLEFLSKLRNDKITVKNSLNLDFITIEEYEKWFYSSLGDSSRKIYIVEEANNEVGTVRVDIKNNKKIISWTVAPEHRGKGYAKKMVKMLVDSLDNYADVIAIMKKGNTASIKVAEYAGLKLQTEKNGLLVYHKK